MTATIEINTLHPMTAVTPSHHECQKQPQHTVPASEGKDMVASRHVFVDVCSDSHCTYSDPIHLARHDDDDDVIVDMDEKQASRGTSSSSTSLPAIRCSPNDSHEMRKLVFGASGIYFSYLYCGSLQEDVFCFKGDDGQKFVYAWWLQFLEAAANVVVGYVGQHQEHHQHDYVMPSSLNRPNSNSLPTASAPSARKDRLPLLPFFASGASQVISKACTALALAHGLSFPVAVLAKSGKMGPVMIGQLIIGGSHYTVRDYLQVCAIIGGTALLGMGNNFKQSSWVGVFFILLSLAMDGVTAGLQKRLQLDLASRGVSASPYDFMLYTNLSMMIVALVIGLHEFQAAWTFSWHHPQIWNLILPFSACSAIGQSFIFYTVAHFDPLVCSTITTSRKMASVLFSIFAKGHTLSNLSWVGITMAFGGVLSEIQAKLGQTRKIKSAT